MKRKTKTPKRAGIPKKVRKLVIEGELWRWVQPKSYWSGIVPIWTPAGEKYLVQASAITGEWSDSSRDVFPVLPGDVRRYIENHLMATPPTPIVKDPKAVVGRMFFFNNNNGTFLSYKFEPGASGAQMAAAYSHICNKNPVLLVEHWVTKKHKRYHYKILCGKTLVTVSCPHPRKWSNWFSPLRYRDEKAKNAFERVYA